MVFILRPNYYIMSEPQPVSSLNFSSFMVANRSLPQNREVFRITELW